MTTTSTTASGVFTFQSFPFFYVLSVIYMMVLFQATIIHGQDVDICACSPSLYRLQIDPSLTCDNNALTANFRKGLSKVNCDISFGPTDIVVKSIKFTEIDQYGDIRKEREVSRDNLQKFAFRSDLPTSVTDVPMRIEITLTGVSKDGKSKTNTNYFEFSNYCAGTPALQPGEGTGWVRFSSLGPPDSELCSNPL